MEQIQKGFSQIPQAPVTPSQNSTSYGCRLPPIDTEVFSGDCRWTITWKHFSMCNTSHRNREQPFQSCLTFLQYSGVNIENWDPILVYMCSTKLPKLTLSLWEQSVQNKAEIPTWLELDCYLTERHRTLEAVDSFRSAHFLHVQSKDTNRVAEFPKINSFNTRLVPIPKVCDLCSKKNHPVRIRPRFLQMTVDDRLAYIKRKQLCSNCYTRYS